MHDDSANNGYVGPVTICLQIPAPPTHTFHAIFGEGIVNMHTFLSYVHSTTTINSLKAEKYSYCLDNFTPFHFSLAKTINTYHTHEHAHTHIHTGEQKDQGTMRSHEQ